MNLPTALTVTRIFLVPLLVAVLLAPPLRLWDKPFFSDSYPPLREALGITIFLLAAATDFLDGYLARRRNQVTTLGTLLDPIADKLLTSAAFISLVQMPRMNLMHSGFEFVPVAPAWMVVIIIGREFIVSGLRSILATRGIAMPASVWGKLKTGSQIVAISLLILTNTLDRWGRYGYLGIIALWLSVVFALWSAADYVVKFVRAVPHLTDEGPAVDEFRETPREGGGTRHGLPSGTAARGERDGGGA
jgi:CDP-diacylglycerol---glycerol-3-phosphate 3-phosphatidyltransferase